MSVIGTMKYLTIGNSTYEIPGGTVTSIGLTNATNGGLTISGGPITSSGSITVGHTNVLTSAQTTQAVYPIKIDKNGHISEYGSAVTIPVNRVISVAEGQNDGNIRVGTVGNDGTASYKDVPVKNLKTVATSGSYNDLTDRPTIPTVPTNVSAFTNDAGYITSYTDEKLTISVTTSGTTYYPIVAADSTAAATRQYDNDGFEYYGVNGVSGELNTGQSRLTLGNNKALGTSKWKRGILRLYGTTTYYVDLKTADGKPTANRTITIPDADGTLALTSDLSGFLSSASLSGTYDSTTKNLTLSITTS